MSAVTVIKAKKNDIDWVNTKYQEVDFVSSNYDNEHIVIAEVNHEKAGLGRLVKIDDNNIELGGIYVFPEYRGLGVAERIVSSLCNENPFNEVMVWCLPFEKLLPFYSKFGFKSSETVEAPKAIAKKLNWCNSGDTYAQHVLLLCKANTL